MAARPTRVVAATDLSPGADAALRCGVAWAIRAGLPLEVVHVLEGAGLAADARAALIASLESRAAEAGASDLPDAPPVVVEPARGSVADTLRDLAAGALLVVAAEGSSATFLRRAGRVPEELARTPGEPRVAPAGPSPRDAPGPAGVLIAPRGWSRPSRTRRRAPPGSGRPARARTTGDPFAPVMVGLAGPERAAALLAAALDLAGDDAPLALAHSVDLSADRHLPPHARNAARELAEGDAAVREQRLRDLVLELVPVEREMRAPVAVHVVPQGPPDRDLAGLAASQSMALLVVGSGPTAARLAGVATVPVLVLPNR